MLISETTTTCFRSYHVLSTPELPSTPLAFLLRPLSQRSASTEDCPPCSSVRTGLDFSKMPEPDAVSESSSRASMWSATSVISTASNAAGEVMKWTTSSIVWFLLYALLVAGYLILPGSSMQECAFLTQIGCARATGWVALRLVVDASVVLGTYFGIQSAVSPVVVYRESTTSTTLSTKEAPYNYDRIKRGTLEEIEAAVNKATHLQVTELFDGVNSTVKITTETPDVVNSTGKVTAATSLPSTSLPSTYNLILDLNVTSKSTRAGEAPASTDHPLTKALPIPDLEALEKEALFRVSVGLGTWAATMVVILTITCAWHRRTREQMRRRIRRLRAGLRSIARTEMHPYAVDLQQPIQSLARIQAALAAGHIEHNSRIQEETTPPPSPPPSPTPPPPPPPSPEGIPMVKFATPLDPKLSKVSKVLSNNQRVDDLEAMDHWANESLDEVNGFANQTFNHIYGNCDAIYDLPPPLPPRPAGILKKTIDRVYSFSRKPTATVRPNMA